MRHITIATYILIVLHFIRRIFRRVKIINHRTIHFGLDSKKSKHKLVFVIRGSFNYIALVYSLETEPARHDLCEFLLGYFDARCMFFMPNGTPIEYLRRHPDTNMSIRQHATVMNGTELSNYINWINENFFFRINPDSYSVEYQEVDL